MIDDKRLNPKKSTLAFLGISALSSFVCLQSQAQNKEDDLALIDKMLEYSQQVDLEKEMKLQLRILKDRYNATVVSIQQGKIKYYSQQPSSARRAFMAIPKTDPEFEEMIFTFFAYASKYEDNAGKKEAATLLIENNIKAPKDGVRRRLIEDEMTMAYLRANKKDKAKFALLGKYCKANGFEVPLLNPIDDLIAINDAAEKIIMQDLGVEKGAKVDTKALEKLIKDVKDMEWGEQNYNYFLSVNEKIRAMILLGQIDEALKELAKVKKHFTTMDDMVKKSFEEDNAKAPRKEKKTKQELGDIYKAISLFAGARYSKGLAYYILAKKLKKNNSDKTKSVLNKAASNFYLCNVKNKGSQQAYKSILRFDLCRDLAKDWYKKTIRSLPVSQLELGKAYYGLGYYERALSYFDSFLPKAASKEGYEAIFLAVPTLVKLEKIENVEKYLTVLEKKYPSYDSKPGSKKRVEGSLKYMSGVYKVKKDAEKDDAKKKVLEAKQYEYFERANNIGTGSAPITYALAAKKFDKVIDDVKKGDRKVAAESYTACIATYQGIIDKYPSSEEAVKAYRQIAKMHSYFKKYEEAAMAYEEYYKRLATPDVAGRVEKAKVIFDVGNIYFKKKNYAKAQENFDALDKFMSTQDLKSDDANHKKVLASLEENGSLLKIFCEDFLSFPKKKEVMRLKKELKANPENAEIKGSLSKAQAEVLKDSKTMITSFDKWLNKFPKSIQRPVVMAKLGGIYQEIGDDKKTRVIYNKLEKDFPDHPIVKQISLNIVRVHLDRGDIASAADSLDNIVYSEQIDASLEYLASKFLVTDFNEDEMSKETLKKSSEILLKVTTELDKRLVAAKEKINKIHYNQYRRAYGLYHLGRLDESQVILDKIAKEKERGPYIFKISFLQGAIASQKKDYNKVMGVYANLVRLNASQGDKRNWAREVQILTEWSSAYMSVDGSDEASKRLLLRGYGSANQAKDTNVLGVKDQETAQKAVEKGWYLAIYYGFKLGKVEESKAMKGEFTKKFPRSAYAQRVRRLKE